jgi:hypothetical protein
MISAANAAELQHVHKITGGPLANLIQMAALNVWQL